MKMNSHSVPLLESKRLFLLSQGQTDSCPPLSGNRGDAFSSFIPPSLARASSQERGRSKSHRNPQPLKRMDALGEEGAGSSGLAVERLRFYSQCYPQGSLSGSQQLSYAFAPFMVKPETKLNSRKL